MKQEHTTKLFGSDQGERSHVWLEGAKVDQAGFKIGDTYHQLWRKDKSALVLCKEHGATTDEVKVFTRKVNKQGTNPAIRMEGKRVQEFFAGFTTVKATFEDGVITLVGHDRLGNIPQAAHVDAVQSRGAMMQEPIKEAA